MARLTIAALANVVTDIARTVTTAVTDLGATKARVAELEARIAELEQQPAQRRAAAPARPAGDMREAARRLAARYPQRRSFTLDEVRRECGH